MIVFVEDFVGEFVSRVVARAAGQRDIVRVKNDESEARVWRELFVR